MSDRLSVARTVISELRELKSQPPFQPTSDIDMVWGLSAPGTVYQTADDGAYSDISFDRQVVDHQIEVVRGITAVRLGKSIHDVTRDDVAGAGPNFFYNGEDDSTENKVYDQNDDLKDLVSKPNFPIPRSKILIGSIPNIGTHTQVQEFAKFLQAHPEYVGKTAVVSLAPHSIRVGRFINRFKDMFPAGVSFVNAPVPQTHNAVRTTFREVTKVQDYVEKGWLTKDSIF